jgi:hypothetical protein
MRTLSVLGLLLSLVVSQSQAQLFQGPASGSVAGGVITNTGTFAPEVSRAGPVARPAKNKERVAPLPDPPDLPPPTMPEGANFMKDPSLEGAPAGYPPINLKGFGGIAMTSAIPPDPHIAVGPDHVIQVVNTSFRITDKNGVAQATISADSWYSGLVPGVFTYDPKIHYDHFAGRWIMVWLDVSTGIGRGNYLLSVSDDSDPNGVWYNWALPSNVNGAAPSGNWADYQGVGFDGQALYFTSNQFSFAGSYEYVKMRIIAKAQLYSNTAGPVSWTDFWDLRDEWGNTMIGVRPAVVYTAPGEYYLTGNSPFTTSTYITLYRLLNPLSAPSLSIVNVPVAATALPPNAVQPSGVTPLDGGGYNAGLRCEPVYRDSSLWLAHGVRSGPSGQYSSVRYLRIDVTTSSASEDVVFGADGYWHIYPALVVDKDNNVAVTYTRTSASEYASACYAWRLDTDAPGLQGSEVFRAGASTYVRSDGSRNRWGDYMGIALDPADRNNFWAFTEYVPSANSWGTWVQSFRLAPYAGVRLQAGAGVLDFGRMEAGTADTLAIALTNFGADPASITAIGPLHPAYTLLDPPALPVTIPTFDSLTIRVVFAPDAHGLVLDTLRLSTNDGVQPEFPIPLSGKGVVFDRAVPGVIYSSSALPAGSLYSINASTGAATVVGPLGINELHGLAIHRVTQQLYGINSTAAGSTIYKVSPGFGDALIQRSIPIINMRAIAFGEGDTLYGGTTTGKLYKFNIVTGDTIFVGTATGVVYSSFSVHPVTGMLWAGVRPPGGVRDRIYRVDPATGAATLLGTTGDGAITQAVTFDHGGRLYGLKGTGVQTSSVITIDTATGAGTLLGSAGVSGLLTLVTRSDSAGASDVDGSGTGEIPTAFALEQNYPNPFNPVTSITFRLPSASHVRLEVFDLLGKRVATLLDEQRSPGVHTVAMDASALSSGTYLCRMTAGGAVATRKMMVLR